MKTVERSIEINQPVNVVYNQWTQFEHFPHFMSHVKEVRQLDEKHLLWRAELGGKKEEWCAEIYEQIPDQRIAWRSTDGAKNSGIVTFQALDNGQTRVVVNVSFDPTGAAEKIGSALGLMGAHVGADLERFKKFIERRGVCTGAWRGEIHQEDVDISRTS